MKSSALVNLAIGLFITAATTVATAADFTMNVQVGSIIKNSKNQNEYVPGADGYDKVGFLVTPNSNSKKYKYTITEANYSKTYSRYIPSWTFKTNLVSKGTDGSRTFSGIRINQANPREFQRATVAVSAPNKNGFGTIEMRIENIGTVHRVYRIR